VLGALDFMKHVYGVFGMTYKLERSTRPKKAVGLDTPDGVKRWDDAEDALAAALDKFAGPGNWKDNPGDGAFYGPKIDIKVFDCMERVHQCATIQVRLSRCSLVLPATHWVAGCRVMKILSDFMHEDLNFTLIFS